MISNKNSTLFLPYAYHKSKIYFILRHFRKETSKIGINRWKSILGLHEYSRPGLQKTKRFLAFKSNQLSIICKLNPYQYQMGVDYLSINICAHLTTTFTNYNSGVAEPRMQWYKFEHPLRLLKCKGLKIKQMQVLHNQILCTQF